MIVLYDVVNIIIPIFQICKLRNKVTKELAQVTQVAHSRAGV